jgi:proline/betaine transport protein TphA
MQQNSKLNIIAGLYGNALEWYDFLLYASFAPLFAKLFFPTHSYFISLVSTFGVFALGFLIRPLGGIVLGHYGDKLGRRKTLIFSVSIMTLATFCIAALPSYNYIGIAAPILFTFLRLLQGFAVGGELPSSATFVIESMLQKYKGLAGSLVFSTAFLGIVAGVGVATAITNVMSGDELIWSWRLAYLLGGALGLIGIYLRVKSQETDEYLHTKKCKQLPFKLIFSQHKIKLLIAVLLTSVVALGNYFLIAYANVFLMKSSGFTLPHALEINFIALTFLTLFIPIMGTLSDYIGYSRLFKVGLFLLIAFIFPVFLLLQQHDFIHALYGELLLSVLLAPINATIATLITDMFPTDIRASGISIGYNIGQALFGGTLPLIAITLIEFTGNQLAPAWYIFGWSVFVFVAITLIKIVE